jgi:hypothetical protein
VVVLSDDQLAAPAVGPPRPRAEVV